MTYIVIFEYKNGEEYRVKVEYAENKYTACMGATAIMMYKLGRKATKVKKIIDVLEVAE